MPTDVIAVKQLCVFSRLPKRILKPSLKPAGQFPSPSAINLS